MRIAAMHSRPKLEACPCPDTLHGRPCVEALALALGMF